MMIPRIRTIRETAEYFRQEDSGTYVSEAWLRKQVQLGIFPIIKSGNRCLLSLDDIERILSNPQLMTPKSITNEPITKTRIRRID